MVTIAVPAWLLWAAAGAAVFALGFWAGRRWQDAATMEHVSRRLGW